MKKKDTCEDRLIINYIYCWLWTILFRRDRICLNLKIIIIYCGFNIIIHTVAPITWAFKLLLLLLQTGCMRTTIVKKISTPNSY
jgi:hypothetical protein